MKRFAGYLIVTVSSLFLIGFSIIAVLNYIEYPRDFKYWVYSALPIYPYGGLVLYYFISTKFWLKDEYRAIVLENDILQKKIEQKRLLKELNGDATKETYTSQK